MDVMKAVKNVLSGAFILALIAITFSPLQARADGMPGVTETDREIRVNVPKFCRSVKFIWEVHWEETLDNKSLMLGFTHKDKGAKIVARYPRPGVLSVDAVWSGGEVVHIPKFDAKGNPIKVTLVSILGLGDDDRAFDTNNWRYEGRGSRWVKGATISPSVRAGTWGECA